LTIPAKARREELVSMTNLMLVVAINHGKVNAPGTKNTGVHNDNKFTLCKREYYYHVFRTLFLDTGTLNAKIKLATITERVTLSCATK
jgi:hypothetical protein